MVVAEVAGAATLIAHAHASVDYFKAAAAEWIDQPEFAADWITRAGVGVYPPVFVDRLQRMMRIEDQEGEHIR